MKQYRVTYYYTTTHDNSLDDEWVIVLANNPTHAKNKTHNYFSRYYPSVTSRIVTTENDEMDTNLMKYNPDYDLYY